MNAPAAPALAGLHAPPAAESLDALVFANRFAALPADFFSRVPPTALPAPYWVGYSAAAGGLIGLDAQAGQSDQLLATLAGNRVPAGADPLAAVYSGHQFGVYVPRLGDGRALLLGEVTGPDGSPWEIQLKGAGLTPYSRSGDGRAVLRSSIREFLGSEAMAGLGIPTTRALALVGSDTPVFRETTETAAVVTRLAPSFVRFGSFEYFAHTGQTERLRELVDYVVARYYPAVLGAPDPLLAWLGEVVARTARLIARWQGVGFMHGVMNSDNMSILGLTLDYGPFQFMDGFDAAHICNHSDTQGRYAWHRQPEIGLWNLYALGQALLPLGVDEAALRAVLDTYREHFGVALEDEFHAKLGLATRHPDDEALIEDLLRLLHEQRVDWPIFWRRLCRLPLVGDAAADASLRDLFSDRPAFDAWALRYRARLAAEASVDAERAARMLATNPKYVLRNWIAEEVIRAARGDAGPRDFKPLADVLRMLERPYDEAPEFARYAALPPDWAAKLELSCSS
ncbi:MAG: YdiU family protein [Ideonella sp.]|nr:YdiU family protein [Ideonella sp.]